MTDPGPAQRPRRRRAVSLNGLAIQVSAFALSFTLVALFVVGSSRAAFVEENETVTSRQAQAQATAQAPDATPSGEPAPSPAPRGRPPAPAPAPTPVAEPPAVQEVALTDDSTGTAMYADQDGLVPGLPEERCIRVTFDGSTDAGPVVLYAASAEGPLAPFLDITVQMGEDGGFGDCSAFTAATPLFAGTLDELRTAHGSYDAGITTWAPGAPGESRSFRFTVAVRDDPAAEGLSASFGLTWEVRTG